MSTLRGKLGSLVILGLALGGAAMASGCTTDAFCFSDCGADGGFTEHDGGGGSGGVIEFDGGAGGQGGGCVFDCNDGGPTDACTPTNDGNEICDGLDNDCNGKVDDVDFSSPKSCGTCQNNCYQTLLNVDPASITCDPSADPGNVAGTCKGSCAQDYFDLDGDGSCEYYCVKSADDDSLCNNKDDDCDGQKDEDVDLCTSPTDCGKCGGNCVVLHGTPACVHTGNQACDTSNTQCQIQKCDCNGPGDCWWDLDNSYATGCEYQCDLTNGGVEICDGIDNDCDGKIDNADDLSGDANIGKSCFGSPNGICAQPAHAGTTVCDAGKVVCSGPNVLLPGQQLEKCNGLDDDCNGAVDDKPTDVGGACGVSNVFPCSFGAYQCQGGQLVCVGAVDPGTETCNGQDDDCDGTIDDSPSDAVGSCNVPTPPPPGATSPCKAGTKSCVGGAVVCQGSVGPSGQTDTCGVDANCDGQLTNQPNLQTDVANCGSCGNDCYAGSVHASFSCTNGQCKFQGCQPGYYDLNNDGKCEYACSFVSAQETCNGLDDNCNGQIDENVALPSPTQVCGVSPSATSPECTTGVTVACVNGSFKCSFPAGVCSPTCAGATEICDNLDNNCNGALNENVSNYNKPCASDDGKPPPGDGVCRTTGTYVCNGPNATKCSAVKDLAKAGPELCDGADNDCDGLIDEPFTNKGTNTTYFVKPAVTKLSASLWIFSYEASRPSATAVTPGTGNGYFTSAPNGVTLDKTPACSVQGKIPWFNVTPAEVEQTCTAMGGKICDVTAWQTACYAAQSCKWGYAPAGSACKTVASYPPGTKYCNLGPFDFNTQLAGDQDGLLVTGSASLKNCYADWASDIFDITGNLREITKIGNTTSYPLMGGAYNTQSEDGATCDFDFYTVDQTFKLYDAGFRCCFSTDPTL